MQGGTGLLGAGMIASVLLAAVTASAAPTACLTGSAAQVAGDAAAIRVTRAAIDAICPCALFDGSATRGTRAYRRCARRVIDTLIDAGVLGARCRTKVRRLSVKSTCGYPASPRAVVCVRRDVATGNVGCDVRVPASACSNTPQVERVRKCSRFTHCIDAADTDGNLVIAAPGDTGACTGASGKRLAELVNAYRVANGKPAHPLSPVLMATAGAHVADLNEHPEIDSGVCVPHSWSSHGGLLWSGCCYTVDHAQADCMWRKPRELSAGLGLTPYIGSGYEIALRGFAGNTPEQVMEAFAASPPHRAVMLSTNGWEFLDANPAMGAAMLGKYSVIWFGD